MVFFSVGFVIRTYYSTGLFKLFRKLSSNILLLFSGLIISRIISLMFTILLLCIISYFMFDYLPSVSNVVHYIIGAIIGLSIFSFIGLCLSFSNIKDGGSEKGISNLIYFVILFTSMAFCPVKLLNKIIGTIGDYLPLNPILYILRGENINYYILLFWLIIPMMVLYIIIKRIKFNR